MTTSPASITRDEPDESTRLLPDAEHGTTDRARNATPLPKVQLGILVAVRVVNPIAYMQIFPYVNQFLVDMGVAAPEHVGFYSGFVESAYSLAQMVSVYQLGSVSDVVGRRPVLLFILLGTALSTLAFGLSTSLLEITAARFLGGLVSGSTAVSHALLVEMTDDTNRHAAVPIFSLSWSMGAVLGPLIGGTLANAATRYPDYFSWRVFVDHPYFPPCAVTAVCALFGALLGYFLIEETLPSKRKDGTNNPGGGALRSAPASPDGSVGAIALLGIPAIRALALSGFFQSFLSSSFDVVFALLCYTPVYAGGLGLKPAIIGSFFAFSGTFAVFLRLVALPYLLRRFDHATTYGACMHLWPLAFASLPLLSAIARGNLTWMAIALILALSKVAGIPYSMVMLLVERHAPTRGSALGRSNGLVQLAMSLGRAIGPVVVGALFTALNGSTWASRWGVRWAWSVVMVCFAVVGARATKGIR